MFKHVNWRTVILWTAVLVAIVLAAKVWAAVEQVTVPVYVPATQVSAVCQMTYGLGPHTACALRDETTGNCHIFIAIELSQEEKDSLFVYWSERCP